MTPKEKAKELIRTFYSIGAVECKQCALIVVDEILDLDFDIRCDATERCVNPVMKYWEEVKQEIEKL